MTRYWPLARDVLALGSPFGPRDGGFHAGQDFPAAEGTPIYACAGGTVLYLGAATGYGQWIVLDHPDADGGGVTEYGHMWNAAATGLQVGDRVEAGQLIAYVGNNGESTGPHLHLSVMPRAYQPAAKIDPLPWLADAAHPGEDPEQPEEHPVVNTFFADVSYFQTPVDDTYPYQVLSLRSNDGDFRDPHFAHNYRWAVRRADADELVCFVVYFYFRRDWSTCVETMRAMVEAEGGPHPQMIAMIDVESGGNPHGDQSAPINAAYDELACWLGDPRRVIGYANRADFEQMWPTRPDGLRVIGAGYGRNPWLAGQIAHQYTDGGGYGDGLPEGAPPFGDCDMNVASDMTPQQFAAACGIHPKGAPMALTEDEQREQLDKIRDIWTQLRGPDGDGWPQLGDNAEGQHLTPVDKLADIAKTLEGLRTPKDTP